MTVRRLLQDKARPWLLGRQGVELSEVTMPGKRYKVTLEPDERGELEKLISRGKGAARRLAHARILLHADQGEGRRARWTLRVLAERMVVLGYIETVSYETVRTTLQETNLNHI